MRALNPAQLAALAEPATMLVTLWHITRLDGTVIRLTDSDVPVVVDGDTYHPKGSTDRTAIRLRAGLTTDNLDVSGVLTGELILEDDLQRGLYDHADMQISLAFANAELPAIPLAVGRWGEVQLDQAGYTVQINGLTQALQATIGESTTPTCRANFGDSRCKASLATWRHTYTLASVASTSALTLTGPSLLDPSATYAGGLLEVMDGPAQGLRMEVRTWDVGTLAVGLYLPLATLPVAGNSVRLTAGCDKTRQTCQLRYGNVINFRGEPDIPGIDALAAPQVA